MDIIDRSNGIHVMCNNDACSQHAWMISVYSVYADRQQDIINYLSWYWCCIFGEEQAVWTHVYHYNISGMNGSESVHVYIGMTRKQDGKLMDVLAFIRQ